MKHFKFLSTPHQTNWRATGLLDMVTNESLMIRVLNLTKGHLFNDESLSTNETVIGMMFPIMYKLFHDKCGDYCDDYIQWRINHVIEYIRSPELNVYIIGIQTNAWTTVDVEAELINIIYEKQKWDE